MSGSYNGHVPSLDARCTPCFERQHGLITHGQATGKNATPKQIRTRLRTGRWVRVSRTVYRLAGVAVTWQQKLLAVLLASPRTTASHRSAGVIWELDGIKQTFPEVAVAPGRPVRGVRARVHQIALDAGETTEKDGFRVTTPLRTLMDLSVSVSAAKLERAIDDALRRKLVTHNDLQQATFAMAGRPGVTRWRAAVADVLPDTEKHQSRRETLLARTLRRAKLPLPDAQAEVRLRGRIFHIDFAYVDRRIAIEYDGYLSHTGRDAFESDAARFNALQAAGWRIVRITSAEMRRSGAGAVAEISDALEARAAS